MTATGTPVLFIHGLWLHATSWNPWLEVFSAAGFAPTAPGWPGEPATVAEARQHPEAVAGFGIEEVTLHYKSLIDGLDTKPILIGHSFGGMIAEKLLGDDYGSAAIAIDAAQIKGVLPLPLSSLRSTLPVFKNPANKERAVSLTADEFRYSFGNAVSAQESDELHERWTIPVARETPLPGSRSELLTTLTGQGRHRQQPAGAVAAHHGRPGPHRPRGNHPGHLEAVSAFQRGHRAGRVRRPRPFLDHRRGVARRRQHLPHLADCPRTGPRGPVSRRAGMI